MVSIAMGDASQVEALARCVCAWLATTDRQFWLILDGVGATSTIRMLDIGQIEEVVASSIRLAANL
jgi:hypothetical protein